MIPAAFDYVRAESADDAIAPLGRARRRRQVPRRRHVAAAADEAAAGDAVGRSIDVGRVRDLSYVRDAGDHVAIGALTRHRDVETNDVLARGVRCAAGGRRAGRRQPGASPRHDRRIGRARRSARPISRPRCSRSTQRSSLRGPAGDREIAGVTISSRDSSRPRSHPTSCSREIRVPKSGRERLRLPEVQPARAGLRDRRRRSRRASTARRMSALVNMGSTPLRATAVEQALAQGASPADAAARDAAEGTEPHRRPQRVDRSTATHLARVLVRARARGALTLARRGGRCSRRGRGQRFGGEHPEAAVASSAAGRSCTCAVDAARRERAARRVLVVVSDDRRRGAWRALAEVARSCATTTPTAASRRACSAALRALEPDADVEAVVVGLADQPLVGADAYRRVAGAFDDGARLAVATYGGVRGQPGADRPRTSGPRR